MTKENYPPLSKADLTELNLRIADLHDQTRYLIVSNFGTMKLFYCISSNTYIMNRINDATRVKDLVVAKAVKSALTDKKKRYKDLEIWKVKESKSKKTVKFIEKVK